MTVEIITPEIAGSRSFTRAQFDETYNESVAGGEFVEIPKYYDLQRSRYFYTFEHIAQLPLPRPARILEIGGGQIAVLSRKLFGDECTVGDISHDYEDAVTRYGIQFEQCNLLTDDLPQREHFDLVVLCEVIEHLPVPGYTVLEKMAKWLRPGGKVFLTTPNLYRFRNVVRLALGMRMFDNYQYPAPGVGLGHQLEYSRDHLAWHLERAGFDVDYVRFQQLANRGHSLPTHLARLAIAPAHLLPRWRDNLLACGTRR